MSHYIEGAKDGIKRRLYLVPKRFDAECSYSYSPAMIELNPGQWVRQIVALDRVKSTQKPVPQREAA